MWDPVALGFPDDVLDHTTRGVPVAAARFWLMKTEPETFGIDDLEAVGREPWDGVRNYQARNLMRDDMKVGDGVLIYHSNAKPPGIAGLARVSREAFPDPTAFDESSRYHDPKSDPEDPRWVMVEVEFVEKFDALVPLDQLKDDPALEGMLVTRRGQRLSIQPVERPHLRHILKLTRARTKISHFTR
jgi:predicted RNA-binding protein with PUA-like domain